MAAACNSGHEADEELTIFAAASLRVVADELETAWHETRPDVTLTIATEASNVLAAQIAEGAGADVFISADDDQPRRLARDGHTAGEPVPFARNAIALVARVGGPVDEAADLARPGVAIVVGGPSTPIGRYTTRAIEQLAATMAQPGSFTAAVEANVASREDNVRAALAKVELGEGDAAFVYRTDALESGVVHEIELPPEARVSAPYSAVQVSDTPSAAEFLAWLGGPSASAVLRSAGFEVTA